MAPSVRRIISWQHSESEFQILCSFHSFLTHCLIFFLGSINIRAAIRIICCHFNTSENHEDVHICAGRAKNDNISTIWVTFELHTVASRWRSREDGGRVTVRLDSCQARDNWFCKGEITGSGRFPAVIVRQNQVLYAKTWSCCCFLQTAAVALITAVYLFCAAAPSASNLNLRRKKLDSSEGKDTVISANAK